MSGAWAASSGPAGGAGALVCPATRALGRIERCQVKVGAGNIQAPGHSCNVLNACSALYVQPNRNGRNNYACCMDLTVGIAGLPNLGKATLSNV